MFKEERKRGIGEIKWLIPLPHLKKPIHNFDGEHYWEIGKAGYPLSKIISDIQRTGFKIIKTYRIFEHPYHKFFILKKINIQVEMKGVKMLAKRLKAKIGEDKTLILHIPDMPQG